MKLPRFAIIVLLGFVCLNPVLAEKISPLPDAIGIKHITFATVIYSPKGFSSQGGRVAAYINDQKQLESLLELLSHFPSQGGEYKKWPKDIAHWHVYIHDSNKKIIALNIYNHSLQSPIDNSFSSSADDSQNTKLMKLLKEMLKSNKKR